MPNESEDSGKGIILGAVLMGRTRETPINYYPEKGKKGVVKMGLKLLGYATTLNGAIRVAQRNRRFRQSDRLEL